MENGERKISNGIPISFSFFFFFKYEWKSTQSSSGFSVVRGNMSQKDERGAAWRGVAPSQSPSFRFFLERHQIYFINVNLDVTEPSSPPLLLPRTKNISVYRRIRRTSMRDLAVDLSRLRAVITKFSMNFTDDFKSFEHE